MIQNKWVPLVRYKIWAFYNKLYLSLNAFLHLLLISQNLPKCDLIKLNAKHENFREQALKATEVSGLLQCLCEHRVLVIAPRFKGNRETLIESDFCSNVVGALKQFGCKVMQYWPSEAELNNPLECSNIKRRVATIIEESSIEYLFLDLNISRKLESLNPSFFLSIKREFGVKIVFLSWDWSVKKFEHWSEVADYFTSNRPSKFDRLTFLDKSKVLGIPGIIYPEEVFPQGPKVLDFFFSGARNRGRKIFLNELEKVHMRKEIWFHSNQRSSMSRKTLSPTLQDYYKSLSSSLMTFSNGFNTLFDSHLTSRFSESILTKTICFYEPCDDLEIFFPRHFEVISVRNRVEFREKLQTILGEPQAAIDFAEKLNKWYSKNYGSKIVLDRIFHEVQGESK